MTPFSWFCGCQCPVPLWGYEFDRRSARSHQKSQESEENWADSNFHDIIFCFGNWLDASATFLQPCLGLILMINSWCASLFQNLLIYRIRIAESSLQSGYYTNCWWTKSIEPWLWRGSKWFNPPKSCFFGTKDFGFVSHGDLPTQLIWDLTPKDCQANEQLSSRSGH